MIVHSKAELKALGRKLGVRSNWHEPDEQNVTVQVYGRSFDNAGFGTFDCLLGMNPEAVEQFAAVYQNGTLMAEVNLAMLFAWATGYEDEQPTDLESIAREMFPDAYEAITDDSPMPHELAEAVLAERRRRIAYIGR